MSDQTLREHAGAIMCDAARDVELHTIQEHLADQAGERVDPMTIQDIADLISKASITIDWPDQPSETARLREQLNRANTERQTLAAELADATMNIEGYAAERDRLTAELATMTKIAQGNQRHVAYLTAEFEREHAKAVAYLQWRDHTAAVASTLVDTINGQGTTTGPGDLRDATDLVRKVLTLDPEKTYGQHIPPLTPPNNNFRPDHTVNRSTTGEVAGGLGSSRRAQEPPMRAGQLARMFHETYEELAPLYGYRTREASAKPWDDVPRPNRELMIATCARVLLALFPLVQPKTDTKANLRTLAEVRGPGPGLPQLLADRIAQADAQDPAPTTAASSLVVAAVARALREHAGRRADEIRHLAETLDGAELGAALGDLMADHWDELATEALTAARQHGAGAPEWAMALVRGLAKYEEEHPTLYAQYAGSDRYRVAECPGALLDAVPAEVRKRAEEQA